MKRLLFYIFFSLLPFLAWTQEEFGTGLLPDDGTYELLPIQAPLIARGVLPSKYSLLAYCPEVKSQGRYATCSAWATAYAARTIMEAVNQGWTERAKITKEAFSPLFIYAQIKKNPVSVDCNIGTHITNALDIMVEKGVSKFSLFDVQCADYVNNNLKNSAKRYKIDSYKRLFDNSFTNETKLNSVKTALSENKPVVIGMYKLPPSFQTDLSKGKEDWGGDNKSYKPNQLISHAMCVIGYDNNRNGGSFQIMNSWVNWGNKGIGWVKYKDFLKYTQQAYELVLMKSVSETKTEKVTKPTSSSTSKSKKKKTAIENVNRLLRPKNKTLDKPNSKQETTKSTPKQKTKSGKMPEISPIEKQVTTPDYQFDSVKLYDFEGAIDLQLSTGDTMEAALNTTKGMPYYRTADDYVSHTRFKVFVTDNEPAYVYAISSNQINKVSKVFPPADNISAALTYKSNQIDLYNGFKELDDTPGTDYFCVLYSIEELDINAIVEAIKSAEGSFYDKVQKAIGDKSAAWDDINYSKDKISFQAHSTKTLVPLIVEISHK